MNFTAYLAWTRKAIVNVAALLGVLGTLALPNPYQGWVTAAAAVVGAILHFRVPNADQPGAEPGDDADDLAVDGDYDNADTPALPAAATPADPDQPAAGVPPPPTSPPKHAATS